MGAERNEAVLDVDGPIAVITLNRPEHRNAFSGRMGAEWAAAYRTCDADDRIRAVVVTGEPAGRAFCAGADLGRREQTFGRQDEATFSAGAIDMPAWQVRKPVIAAVNGHAIGIGLSLALQCDLRIVANDAKLAFAHVRRGVLPDASAHWTVVRAVGLARAADVLLSGRTFTGAEAARLGIANEAVQAEDVLPLALARARDLADNTAPVSVALSKRLLWLAAAGLTPEEVGRLETAAHHVVMGRPDATEGVMAFLEKRPPVWTGRITEEWKEPE
jgi:enoyl-CoA hydratase/carnithine racemase